MVNSFSSTVSSSEIESLKDLIGNEEVRYVRKGYGLIFAILLVVSYFFVLPEMLFPLYMMLPYKDSFYMYIFGMILIHFIVFIVANLGIYFIYHLEHPFFERYKITKEP